MFVTLRLYRVNPIFEREFIRLWNELVEELRMIDALEEAVLHKESKISYISYVTWSSKPWHEKLVESPPARIDALVVKVRECCNSITILHRLEVIEQKKQG